jgi:hypothetical protein
VTEIIENSSFMVFVLFPVLVVRKQVTLILARVEATIANIRHERHGSLTDSNSFEIQDGLRLLANAVGLAVCHTSPHRG